MRPNRRGQDLSARGSTYLSLEKQRRDMASFTGLRILSVGGSKLVARISVAIEFMRDADAGSLPGPKGSKCGKKAFSASQSVKKGIFRSENLQIREKSPLSFRTVAQTTIRIERFMSQALGQPGAQAKRRQEN